jgi:hypothetical protein
MAATPVRQVVPSTRPSMRARESLYLSISLSIVLGTRQYCLSKRGFLSVLCVAVYVCMTY